VPIRVQFALCAQSVSVDRASNRLTIINVIDHWPASVIPVVIPAIAFVCIFESDKDEAVAYQGNIEILLNEQRILASQVPISFTNGRLARAVLTINAVPVNRYGSLSFRLAIPNEATAEAMFQVVNPSSSVKPVVKDPSADSETSSTQN
jgi:hypothetical protein